MDLLNPREKAPTVLAGENRSRKLSASRRGNFTAGRLGSKAVCHDLLWLVAAGFAFRIGLLALFPAAYGNDGIGRLYFHDTLFLGHWLPLTQVIVHVAMRLTGDAMAVRVVFAGLGGLAGAAFYLFLRLLTSRRMAFFGGLLFSLNALYVILSLMPYQDVLFLGLFYAALAAFLSRQPMLTSTAGSLFFGLACLTRYESWFLLPAFIVWKTKDGAQAWRVSQLLRRFAGAVAYFGWGPILWLSMSSWRWGGWDAFLHQTANRQFYAWNPHLDLLWSVTYAGRMAYWLILFGSPVILFALAGLVAVYRRRHALHPAMKLLLLFGVLVLIFFFFIIGKGQETVNRFVMIPLSVALVLTILGIEATFSAIETKSARAKRLFQPMPSRLLAIATIGLLAVYATVAVVRLNARPEFRDPYTIAAFLDRVLSPTEKALVVAERFADLSDAAPMAYQRIVVQSKYGRERILSSGLLGLTSGAALRQHALRNNVRYLVVFENFQPFLAADLYFADYPKAHAEAVRAVQQVRSATIYQVISWQPSERETSERVTRQAR